MTPTLLNNRYRIIQTLGSGGFGETFLALDTQMPSGRRCVIKQLKPIANNPQVYQLVQERFQREAAVLENLSEQSYQIPKLYAYFAIDGQFYLVQELIYGQTLPQIVQATGLLSESAVREILISLLAVLDYVHSKGIVHRDIKPDNIILRTPPQSPPYQGGARGGQPVLIDFGAVRETMATAINSQGEVTKSIVIGTPGFMPSEQAIGRPVYASDLYSLGLTAIYLLTGKMPQQLETDAYTGEIIWRQHAQSISHGLASVLDKAIQSHPSYRYGAAQELLDALQRLDMPVATPHHTLPPTVAPPSPPAHGEFSPTVPISTSRGGQGNRPNAFILGGLIASGLIGAAIVIAFALKPSPQPKGEQAVKPGLSVSPSDQTSGDVNLKRSPEQVVRDYYNNINQGKYQTAWRQQSPKLQSNKEINPNGYADYLKFWETVERVEIQEIKLVDKSPLIATVDVRLTYVKKDGKSEPYYWRYFLVWDAEDGSWLLDDRKLIAI